LCFVIAAFLANAFSFPLFTCSGAMADVRGELAQRVRMQQQQWFSDIQEGVIPPTATIFSQDKNGRVIGANQVPSDAPFPTTSVLNATVSFCSFFYLVAELAQSSRPPPLPPPPPSFRCSAHRPRISVAVLASAAAAACASTECRAGLLWTRRLQTSF
jgi:hypothetical protein